MLFADVKKKKKIVLYAQYHRIFLIKKGFVNELNTRI